MRTSLRLPWAQGAPQSNSGSTATGIRRLREGAMPAASPTHSKRSGPHLRAAAPHFRWSVCAHERSRAYTRPGGREMGTTNLGPSVLAEESILAILISHQVSCGWWHKFSNRDHRSTQELLLGSLEFKSQLQTLTNSVILLTSEMSPDLIFQLGTMRWQ